jgi:hypothetical protein
MQLAALITPDNLPAVLTAIGAVLSGVGGWTLWKVRREPPAAGTLDALLIAIAENTAAQRAIGGQFGANLKLFEEANEGIGGVVEVLKDIRTENRAMHEHLNALRDKL